MKKFLALTLAAAMSLSLAGCLDSNSSSSSSSAPAAAPAAPAADDAADADADAGDSADTAAPAASGSAADDGVFRIGVYNWLGSTGLGPEEDTAFEIAMEKYGNEMWGQPIEIVSYDTQNDPTEAVTGVQKLIGDNCDAIIGSFQSSDVVAAVPFLEEAGIFNLMAGTSGSLVTPDQVYSFRGAFNANKTADSYVQVCKDLGYENVAVFYGQDEASISNWEDAIKPAFEAAGLNVVALETGAQADTDFSAQCMKIVNANPDVVYVVCSGAGQNFVKQLREYGYNGIIMNKDEWMTSHVDAVGEANSNYILSEVSYTTYKSLDAAKESGASQNVIDFLEEYYAKTESMPTLGITYRMYDCMLIILEAASRAGEGADGKAMADACLTINDLQGCMGTVDFTQGDREPAHEFSAVIYDNGGSRTLEMWMEDGGYDAFKSATGRAK